MAKQHKAATEVTFVEKTEKSLFAEAVERYWKAALAVAVLVSAVILINQYRGTRHEAQRAGRWTALSAGLSIGPVWSFGSASSAVFGDVDSLEKALPEVADSGAEPWARLALVQAYAREREYTKALEELEALRNALQNSNSPEALELLNGREFELGGTNVTLLDHIEKTVAAQKRWEEEHPDLFANPPLPEDAPRVKLVTTAGDIVIGLCEAEAPEHVANFLKLCREGFYVDTKFHRVIEGFMIQGGDPNTKLGDVTNWGEGGPGYTVPREANDLSHFTGMLSAAKKPTEFDSSGSQFFITTGPSHHLDGKHVVYGAVLEGMDVVKAIEEGEIEDPQKSRPVEPVGIVRTEVLGE